MMKWEVRTAEDAVVYITDCNLATVCSMAMKKSRPKYEYDRQKSIAQKSIDWMNEMHIDYSGTRAESVSMAGNVDKWASTFEPKVVKP